MTIKTAVSMAALVLTLGAAPQAMAQTTPAPQRAPNAEQAPAAKAPVAGQILAQDANTVLAKQGLAQSDIIAKECLQFPAIFLVSIQLRTRA